MPDHDTHHDPETHEPQDPRRGAHRARSTRPRRLWPSRSRRSRPSAPRRSPRSTSTSACSSASAPSSPTSSAAPPRSASATSASPGVDLITKVLNLADDFDRAIETRPAGLDGDAWADGHRRHRPQAAPAARERGRDRGRCRARAPPSIPASTRPIVSVPGTGRAEGEIVEEVRRGYRLRDRVIRPALVAVARRRRPGRPDSTSQRIQPTRTSRTPSDQENPEWARSSASTSGRPTASSR